MVVAWAKRARNSGPEGPWLSLLGHSIDVAAVAEALLKLPVWTSRFSKLACRELTNSDVARLCCFALWHDIGKASVGFQSRAFGEREGAQIRREAGLEAWDTGHTRVVAALFDNEVLRVEFLNVFPLREALRWGEGALDLLWAAISHHGAPLYADDRGEILDIEGRVRNLASAFRPVPTLLPGYDPMAQIAALGQAGRTMFPEAFAVDAAPLPNPPGFVHAFAGLVSLADWIASNSEEGFFPYDGASDGRDGEGSEPRHAFASSRAREVLARMRLDPAKAREMLNTRAREAGNLQFGDVFRNSDGAPYEPTGVQAAMGDPSLGQVVVVESETGSGKTEAAFWRFATLFSAGQVDGLAFLMPTRISATALMERMETFLRRLYRTGFDDKPPLNAVLGVPGYAYADGMEAVGKLADFRALWPDDADAEKDYRRWAAEGSKRYFAAATMVGTIDQALMGALRVKHAHMRSAALMRSLMVVDEVHASDTYMTYLLEEVLTRHVAAGGHALLLSATLAGEVREKLLAAGRPVRRARGNPNALPSAIATDHSATPYPAVSDAGGVRWAPASTRRKDVTIDKRAMLDDPAAIAATALEAARAGARVLVIRNTVGSARNVLKMLERSSLPEDRARRLFRVNGVAALHHGRYAAEDRRLLDRAVEDWLGKSARSTSGCVVVGTQTLEISLDIDADLLVTDLCPMDVLLQRLGRLHRHQARVRPHGFGVARVVLLVPPEGLAPYLMTHSGRVSHGFRTVYANMPALEATRLDLPDGGAISVPNDCRRLVEGAIDRENLRARCEAWGGAWPKAWQDASGQASAQANIAHFAKFSFSTSWPEQQAFAKANEERLRTRLGGDDYIIELPVPWRSPFGAELTRLKIPGWMVRDATPELREAPASIVAALPGERLTFDWTGRRFSYDALGLVQCNAEDDVAD